MLMDRKYKHFDNMGNEYLQESELAKKNRQLKYLLFKQLKQKLIWKNFLRAFTTGYQVIIFSLALNIKYVNMSKPILAFNFF